MNLTHTSYTCGFPSRLQGKLQGQEPGQGQGPGQGPGGLHVAVVPADTNSAAEGPTEEERMRENNRGSQLALFLSAL